MNEDIPHFTIQSIYTRDQLFYNDTLLTRLWIDALFHIQRSSCIACVLIGNMGALSKSLIADIFELEEGSKS